MDDGHLFIGLDPLELLGKVVGNHRSRTLDGEQFMLDAVFSRRQNMYPLTGPVLNFFADTLHGIAEIDVGDGFAELFQGLVHPPCGQGIDFTAALVNEAPSLKKNQFGDGVRVAEHRPIKIDFRGDPHKACCRELLLKLLEQFLIGKSHREVMKKTGVNIFPHEKFDIGDNLREVIAEYTSALPLGSIAVPLC